MGACSPSRDWQAEPRPLEDQVMKILNSRRVPLSAFATAVVICVAGHPAAAEGLASPWVEGFNNKSRLLAGKTAIGGPASFLAGLEISMPTGWKTYWRAPGDSGVPPEFDWTGSENLDSATVLYPAPHRLIDKGGANIGYKDHVIFPARIVAKDPTKPVTLKLKAAYGVCEKLCVPAEVELEQTIPADAGDSAEIAAVLSTVPRTKLVTATDPVLAKWRVDDRAGKPFLVLEVSDPGGVDGDAFVDMPGGTYLPLPVKLPDANGHSVYEVNLTEGADIKDLNGKPIAVTLTGARGQSETSITLP